MDTDGSTILQGLNESKDLGLNSQRSVLSNNRFNSRKRELSKPKYTNAEIDGAILDNKLVAAPRSDVRKTETQLAHVGKGDYYQNSEE